MIKKLIRVSNYFPFCLTIVDMDSPGRLCVFANDKFYDNTGYLPSEAVGRNLSYLQGKDTSPETIEFMRECFRNNNACIQDVINYKKNGEPFLNRLLMLPIRSQGRLFYFGFQNDVTQLFGLKHDSSKLKNVLSNEICHMVNNPLSIIIFNLGIALDNANSEDQIELAVKNLKNTFERINQFSINLENVSQFEKFVV